MKPDKTKYRHSPLILATVLYFLLGAEQSCLAAGDTIKLAENGQPRASILIPASAAAAPNLAALELQCCVWKISGAILPIRVLDRPFSGVRIQLNGAEFSEAQWQVTPEKLNLRRYEYVIEFSRQEWSCSVATRATLPVWRSTMRKPPDKATPRRK